MSTVAYLGPHGTFTEAAAVQLRPQDTLLPVHSPAEAAECVVSGAAQWAVVAIENSVDGPVTPTFDALASSPQLQIYAETELDVAFAILAKGGQELPEAPRFATHPVAWQQVKSWVAARWPKASFLPASSNADAARMVAESQADVAAAPERAAAIYGLEVLAASVADHKGARTRFVLLGRRGTPPQRTGHDRTAVSFTLPNEPGSLVGALNEFALRGVDLSRIESRPTRQEFGTYRFYADLWGHIEDIPVAEALRALYLRAEELHFLGSWPAASAQPGHTESERSLARIRAAHDFVTGLRRGTLPEPH